MSNEIYYDQMNQNQAPESGKTGLAIASLVMGILGIVLCCCGFGFIAAPLGLIFGIISLVKKRGGKGMAITGIILSALTAVGLIGTMVLYGPVMKDVFRFSAEAQEVIDEFNETGELPDYLDKYNDSKYDSIWESAGYDSFNDYFADVIKQSGLDTSSTSSEQKDRDKENSVKDESVVSLGVVLFQF